MNDATNEQVPSYNFTISFSFIEGRRLRTRSMKVRGAPSAEEAWSKVYAVHGTLPGFRINKDLSYQIRSASEPRAPGC